MFNRIREITDQYYSGAISDKALDIMLTAYTYDSYRRSKKSWLDPLAIALFLDGEIPIK